MSLRTSVKKVVSKLTGNKIQEADLTELQKWKEKFEIAWKYHSLTTMDERELIYNGTHDVDKDINKDRKSGRLANNVVNIVYEFTEAQIDTAIPQPSVKTKRKQYQVLARMVEDSAKNDIDEIGIERINDENERTTPIQGYSLFRVDWDPDFRHHLYRGEIKVTNPHPKQFVPQPGVYNVQEMDYFFLLYSQTKSYVKTRYGIELENENEQYPEINYFHDGQMVSNDSDKVTLIVAVYKDDEGEIGKFTWCNETPLENLPKFYYRRLKRCTKCGAVQGSADECKNLVTGEDGVTQVECGNKKYKTTTEEYETIEQPITLSDGRVIPAGTKVPYFRPTRYPIIVRRNVPVAFQFGGQSDVDLIRDQQDALKKVVSTMEEKLLRGGNIIKALEGHKFKLTGALYEVIRGNSNQLLALGVENLTADIQKDLEFAQYLYKTAQDVLGVTNAWMGKEDTTADSGVAKQIQVQQSSGRLESKASNKYTAFKELYELMFEFKLAYYDELRPYLRKAENNQEDWGEFNKYEFLQQDASGEWYYNTDFLFSSKAGDSYPKEKMWVSDKAEKLFLNGAMDKVGLWTILETLNFPMATEMKDAALKEQQAAMQGTGDKPPSKQISFKDLPPSGKVQMAAQAGIQLSPEDVTAPMLPGQEGGQKPDPAQIEQFITSLPDDIKQQIAALPDPDQQMQAVMALMQQGQGGGGDAIQVPGAGAMGAYQGGG